MIIDGYASVFGIRDLGGDITVKGCFANSIKHYCTSNIKFCYLHDQTKIIADIISLEEDDIGLRVKATLRKTNRLYERIVCLLDQHWDTYGLSIGFRTINSYREDNLRFLTEVDLREISLVEFPMLRAAKILEVKHVI